MRIGVVGPPGVEKTEFAKALADEFELVIIDEYVQSLQARTELALGPWASYSEHFMVAGVRLAAEYEAGGDDRITVGTIIDTLTYAAVKTDVVLQNSPEGIRATQAAAQGAMSGITLMYHETWDYHISFHLPLPDDHESGWEKTLDEGYRIVLESFNVPYLYTLKGTTAERIKIAKEIITLAQENQKAHAASSEITETDEPTV